MTSPARCPAMQSPPFRAWAGRVPPTAILKRAGEMCDAFVSMDGNIEYQQDLGSLSFGVIVIAARSNRMGDLLPVIPEVLKALVAVRPGEIRRVGKATKRRS